MVATAAERSSGVAVAACGSCGPPCCTSITGPAALVAVVSSFFPAVPGCSAPDGLGSLPAEAQQRSAALDALVKGAGARAAEALKRAGAAWSTPRAGRGGSRAALSILSGPLSIYATWGQAGFFVVPTATPGF